MAENFDRRRPRLGRQFVLRSVVFVSIAVTAAACGRDTPTQALGFGDPSPRDGSVGGIDVGLPPPDGGGGDASGPGPDAGRPDTGSGPDFGLTPGDGGSAPDIGLPPVDAGPPDLGSPGDAGSPLDTGSRPDFGLPADGGVLDAGPDGGGFDAGPDAGPPDVGVPVDAGGPLDVGSPDASRPDFGTPDLGLPDLGPPDIGPSDLGSADLGPPDSSLDAGGSDAGPVDTGVDGGIVDAGPPACPGNTCAAAVRLANRLGLQSVVGDTRCANDSTSASCGGTRAPDVVHRLDLTNRRRIVARAASVANGFRSALSLRSQCDVTTSELVCDAGSGGSLAALDRFANPGTYFLWLDGASAGDRGAYRVDVELDPQDTCGDPIAITLPALGSSVDVRGDTSGASDTFQASCASAARSPDHVIALDVGSRARVVVETLAPGGRQYDTALHLRQACVSGLGSPELACDDDGGSGTLSRLDVTLDPGTYHLVVDGFSTSSSGPYTVRITRLAAPTPIRFPTPTDTFSTAGAGGAFGRAGDFVEGRRTTGPATSRALDADLFVAANRLTCSAGLFRVSLNSLSVGVLRVRPTDTRVQATFTLPAGISRPYVLRYELVSSVPAACGTLTLDTTDSTVTLR